MTNKNDGMNFSDPKTLMAIMLVFAIFLGWNSYMRWKYPEVGKNQQTAETTAPADAESASDNRVSVANEPMSDAKNSMEAVETSVEKTTYTAIEKTFENRDRILRLSSLGLAVDSVQLKDYYNKNKEPFVFGSSHSNSLIKVTDSNGTLIPFEVVEERRDRIEARARMDDATYRAEIRFPEAGYGFNLDIRVSDFDSDYQGFQVKTYEHLPEPKESSFLFPSFERHEVFALLNDGSEEHIDVTSGDPQSVDFTAASLFSIASHYFAIALVDASPVMPQLDVQANQRQVAVNASYKPLAKAEEFLVNLKGFIGPKERDALGAVDPDLENAINYGMFSFLAHPMLSLMRWFHSIVGNWGVAIILLTILVRLLVMPFAVISMRSMKSMQKIQPLMQELREKYKDDQQKLNQEMMDLMKTHKVNPVGGCLPMLLQIPVFLALYQVLGQSIELYQAPFMLWIQDLSSKDPYYVLPILMGVTMFFQMRMTSSPMMDPTQKRIMSFMPIVFSLLMISLPSGLTLYIFISTLFGVIQHFALMHERNAEPASA